MFGGSDSTCGYCGAIIPGGSYHECMANPHSAMSRIDKLEKEVCALRKDAERYRWARRNNVLRASGGKQANPDTLDVFIDRAIEFEKKSDGAT